MTVSDIGKIVISVATTELITCILSKKLVFQSESYIKITNQFNRSKFRRDKTATALATKKASRQTKPAQISQKSIDKEEKKLQRDNDELSGYAAEVARRHTMAAFYSSIAFLVLYRILAAEYSGKVVALLPFKPFNLLQRITFRGLLSDNVGSVAEAHSHWVAHGGGPEATIPGVANAAAAAARPDVTSAGQACAFAFVYILCSLSVKMMVNMAFGTKPPAGADDGVGTLIEAPQSQKMLKNFGVDAEDVKEARKAVGFG
mmetsp:Transcript_12925/g.23239  ORF Transcript_12925/g.23239 Transcript_12925/m.23239 type:complete len:260 (+) Transcript_12925:175-954(+)|eukprot:CAMPEP_0196157170 /NCGR_PEP_ID=MMETSP0910-20130528/43560_1 /TAXON_ID=49265 /ORGANISM="Thalassiosira rotula, Strain GSO102" /LENGTH=259 /DNA_ID=CAMNT_0041421785 /DNA_START=132 /DNA_END=911 /DNA_ORIENTATION=+